MALTIYENKESTGATLKIDRRLYLDAAGNLVEDGDPAAATLFCSGYKPVSRADFEAAGGVVEDEPAAVPEPEPEPEPKPKPKRKRKTTKKGK